MMIKIEISQSLNFESLKYEVFDEVNFKSLNIKL